jgi:hypothetical protein
MSGLGLNLASPFEDKITVVKAHDQMPHTQEVPGKVLLSVPAPWIITELATMLTDLCASSLCPNHPSYRTKLKSSISRRLCVVLEKQNKDQKKLSRVPEHLQSRDLVVKVLQCTHRALSSIPITSADTGLSTLPLTLLPSLLHKCLVTAHSVSGPFLGTEFIPVASLGKRTNK